jgi:hypothetical protein
MNLLVEGVCELLAHLFKSLSQVRANLDTGLDRLPLRSVYNTNTTKVEPLNSNMVCVHGTQSTRSLCWFHDQSCLLNILFPAGNRLWRDPHCSRNYISVEGPIHLHSSIFVCLVNVLANHGDEVLGQSQLRPVCRVQVCNLQLWSSTLREALPVTRANKVTVDFEFECAYRHANSCKQVLVLVSRPLFWRGDPRN